MPGNSLAKFSNAVFDFTLLLRRSSAVKNMVKANYWPCVGVTLLCLSHHDGGRADSHSGLLAIFLSMQSLTNALAGLTMVVFASKTHGSAAKRDAERCLCRLSPRSYSQQALYMLIFFAVVMGLMLVLALPLAFTISRNFRRKSSARIHGWLDYAAGNSRIHWRIWYFVLCWLFTHIADPRQGPESDGSHAKLSRRVVHLRFWKILRTLIVVGLICLLSPAQLLPISFIFDLPIALCDHLPPLPRTRSSEEGPVTAFT